MESKWYYAALAMLAKRDYGGGELRGKLLEKGAGEVEVDAIIDDFIKRNYLNDERFARSRAYHRCTISGWGWVKIRAELVQLGLSEELIGLTLEHLKEEGFCFDEQARTLAERRMKNVTKTLPDKEDDPVAYRQERQKERQKRVAWLMRRGFSFDEAMAAVDAALKKQEDE